MPFVHRKSKPVAKNVKPVDPQLLKEVDAIARPYREVMMRLSEVVDQISARFAANPDALTTFQAVLTEEVVATLQAAIPAIGSAGARQVFRNAVEALRGLPNGIGVGFSFDSSDPRAVAWAKLRGGRLIAQITDEQLQMVRHIISNSIANGVPVPQAAEQISQIIGLHDRWQRAVANTYERELNLYISQQKPVEVARTLAREAADKHRVKLIRARALNIARTEVAAAQNYGQQLGWLQAGEKGLINLSNTKKEWVSGPSGWKGIKVCDICAPMNGMQVPVTAGFPNGVLTPPAHPSCRCTMILIPPEV